MAASTAYLLGVIINGKWRWSPVLRVAGASWHVITLAAFVLSAFGAEFGDFMVLASGVFCGVHTVFLWWNIRDMLDAVTGYGR